VCSPPGLASPSPATALATYSPSEASDGTSLWHENIGRMSSAPVTYELDGKRYLLVSGGNTLYAYALP